MKKAGVVIGTVAAAMLIFAMVGRAAPSDKDQIIALEKGLAAAPNTDAALKFYDQTDKLVVFDMIPPLQYKGVAAWRKDLDAAFAGLKTFHVDFKELEVDDDGHLGFAYSIQQLTGTDKNGKPVSFTFRQTDCLRKIDGKWLIVHQHLSLPADLTTGKAVLDASM